MEGGGCQIGTEGRMKTWFNFLFGRKLIIRCLGVFSVCTCRSELIGHPSWRILLTAFLHCSRRRSLWLSQQKSAPWIYSFHPPLQSRFTTFRLPFFFLFPWRMISEDAVLRTTTRCSTACEKSSNVSAKSFSPPVYSVSRKTENLCWWWRKFCGKIIWTLWRLYPWYIC
jgi:hypothetical protein